MFLDADLHERVCPSVGWSVGPLVRWSVGPSVRNAFARRAETIRTTFFVFTNLLFYLRSFDVKFVNDRI